MDNHCGFHFDFPFSGGQSNEKSEKIDSEGVETDAVVSRIEETWDTDPSDASYTTYVTYRDENGETRESPMALTVNRQYNEGDRLRIRFIPGDYSMVRTINN